MYARGILFGKMKYELGDHSFVRCPESGLVADLEFKTKGWVGGSYNAIGGFIKDTKTEKNLFELSGHWNEEMYIKDLTVGKCQDYRECQTIMLTCRRRVRESCSLMRHMRKKRHQKLGR